MRSVNLESIRWVDSAKQFAREGWSSVHGMKEVVDKWNGLSTTTGFNLYEDEDVVVLVQTLDQESHNYAGAFLIHKPSIQSRLTITSVNWDGYDARATG